MTETKTDPNLVVFVSADVMGRGDDALGKKLMGVFLDTLAHRAPELTHVIFVNSGAQLTVEGSPVLEQLTQLSELGAELLTCGTCLDHFNTREKLAVGTASNMAAIIETLSAARQIIQP